MEYELVYEAANGSLISWSSMPFSILMITIGAILALSKNTRGAVSRGRSEKFMLIFSRAFFGMAVLFTSLSGCSTFYKNKEAKLSSKNNCTLIEGEVVDFAPMPYGGGQHEKFKVNNIEFVYSDYVLTGGFNNTASHGGPIFEGQKVRICYFNRPNPNSYFSQSLPNSRVIVRLEVSQ